MLNIDCEHLDDEKYLSEHRLKLYMEAIDTLQQRFDEIILDDVVYQQLPAAEMFPNFSSEAITLKRVSREEFSEMYRSSDS